MKLLILFAIVASCARAGETNVVRVPVTNYVSAASQYREVDGQVYDVTKSVQWQPVWCRFQNYYGDAAVFRKIERIKIGERKPEKVDSMAKVGLYSDGPVIPAQRAIFSNQDGEYFLVVNFPSASIETGSEMTPRLMQVGETNYNGKRVGLYDCGKPHLVPVVSFKSLPH